MPVYQEIWGPEGGFASNDYVLYMEGSLGPTDTPQRLKAHGLGSPNQETRDALRITTTDIVNGKVVLKVQTKYAAEISLVTYTVTYPQQALWTPALAIAQSKGGSCVKNFARVYLCPPDPEFRHWVAMPQGVLNPPVPTEDLITNGEDRNPIAYTSELQIPEEIWGWALGGNIVNTQASKKINDLAFLVPNCGGCDYFPGQEAVIVGGDGTAAPTVLYTANRFSSVTSKTVGTTGDLGYRVYATGNTIVTTTVTGTTFTAATAGKMFVSTNKLATTPSAVTGMIDVISDIVGEGSYIFAVGKDLSGNAVLWFSLNGGQAWTKSTSALLPTGSSFLAAAWDAVNQRLYIVGEDGKTFVARFTRGTLALTDLTANIGGTDDLNAIALLGKNNILVAGALGKAYESRDGGTTWAAVSISGTTPITSLAGNQHRVVAGAGTALYIRDILSDNIFVPLPLSLGASLAGTVASVTMAPDGNFNMFGVTTSSGETAILNPFYPNA